MISNEDIIENYVEFSQDIEDTKIEASYFVDVDDKMLRVWFGLKKDENFYADEFDLDLSEVKIEKGFVNHNELIYRMLKSIIYYHKFLDMFPTLEDYFEEKTKDIINILREENSIDFYKRTEVQHEYDILSIRSNNLKNIISSEFISSIDLIESLK